MPEFSVLAITFYEVTN